MEIHSKTCRGHGGQSPITVEMSIDGVNETKSTSRSLEIVSLKFMTCHQVYPCLISRPEVFEKKRMKASLDVYIASILDEMEHLNVHIEKVVLDAPERAAARKQK